MTLRVVLRPAAEAELYDARDWYEANAGLGGNFMACIDDAIDRIRANPLAHALVHRNVRRALVRRFPYGVFYVVESERIVVMAVFHASRDPAIWERR